MWLTRIFKTIAFRPMEAVEFFIILAVLLSGAWLVSPLYHPATTVSGTITENMAIPMTLGILHLLIAATWFVGCKTKKNSFRRTALLLTFILYSFYGISQVIVYGVYYIPYVSVFTIAFIAGIAYIWQNIGVVVSED